MTDQPKVVRNDGEARYEVWVGDSLGGSAYYTERGEKIAVFTHTEIGDAFAGQGLGKVLAKAALDDVVERGRVIVPECPFIAAYLRKNPGYEDHVRWPSH